MLKSIFLFLVSLLLTQSALALDKQVACDGTNCKVKIYSRVGSTLTESIRVEGGGLTSVGTIQASDANKTLASTDNRVQVFTGFTASRDVTLPSSGVSVGEVWRLENNTSQDMIVKSSDGNAITIANSANNDATVRQGYVLLRANQASPTAPTDWRVLDLQDFIQVTLSCTGPATANWTVKLIRSGYNKTVIWPTLNVSCTVATTFSCSGFTVRFNALDTISQVINVYDNSVLRNQVGVMNIGTDIELVKSPESGNYTASGTCGVQRGTASYR